MEASGVETSTIVAVTFGVLGLLFGGGALIWLFLAGRSWGSLERQVNTLDEMVNDLKQGVGGLRDAGDGKISSVYDKLGKINERVRDLANENGLNQQNIQSLFRDIDQLVSDVRDLLRSESAASNEMRNLRNRIEQLEATVQKVREDVTIVKARIEHGGGHS